MKNNNFLVIFVLDKKIRKELKILIKNPAGVMFHHFYDNLHPRGQGAISAKTLRQLINFLGRENILQPEDFAAKAISGNLHEKNICFTFDDALLCQYDVALPVLNEFRIRAFWFIYSSVFKGGIEPLEVYRFFRTVAFRNIEEFYSSFFAISGCEKELENFDPISYLKEDPFYTPNDRRFRFLRDNILGETRYRALMDEMILASDFSVDKIKDLLWMKDRHLRNLSNSGHVIGLHSFRHPTRLAELSVQEQQQEYTKNFLHIMDATGVSPWAVSHPCNSYTSDTLDILMNLGIKFGFRAYPNPIIQTSTLEFPREDHTTIVQRMSS